MTTSGSSHPIIHGSPVGANGPRVPLYSPEFAADPRRAYRDMRSRFGSLVPVELAPGVPATLVIGYRAALGILNDPYHFPADPRVWQQGVPADCPVLPMLEWRPAAMRSAGEEHTRYRQAYTASLDGVDLYALHAAVADAAVPLINAFCGSGSADLLSQYAFPLTFQVLNHLLGLPSEAAEKMGAGTAAVLDGTDAEKGGQMVVEALLGVVQGKRTQPGDDLTSRLMAHTANFDDMEMVQQAGMLYAAGTEPTYNLVLNTLLLILTDDRFAGDVLGGALSTRDAIDQVLFTDPPLANFCMSYPRQPQLIGHTWLPAHQPVVISLAACNNDPELAGDLSGNRSHLAWGLGPHACVAQSIALVIVQEAIDQLLDALPEIRLAVSAEQLNWRPGAFHRALAALPVVFPPSPAMNFM